MKKRFVCIGILGLLIFLLSSCAFSVQEYASVINANWSIQLPKSYTEVYSTDDGESFLGDGLRYHVFEYEDINDIKDHLDWKTNKNTIVENQVIEILSTLNMDEEYELNFNQSYKYYEKHERDGSSLYLILINNLLYVVEDIY